MSQSFRWVPLPLLMAGVAGAQSVTKVAQVRIDGRVERVRRINGRWWSQDNRQLRPSGDGWLWWIDSKRIPEVVFYHHRPVELAAVESLHLFMGPDAVRSLLGDPNETFESIGVWHYYAVDGTALMLRFFGQRGQRNELGEARYERSDYGVSGRPVASVAADLNGRDIFKLLADRASEKSSPESYGRQPAALSPRPGEPRDPPKTAPRIPADLAKAVTVGMSHADVVSSLGPPHGSMRIAGESQDMETLTYNLDSGSHAQIQLEAGKVARIIR